MTGLAEPHVTGSLDSTGLGPATARRSGGGDGGCGRTSARSVLARSPAGGHIGGPSPSPGRLGRAALGPRASKSSGAA